MMEEAARSRLDVDLLAHTFDVEPVERLHRTVRLALGRAEGREIVVADEHRRAFPHRLHVERDRDVPNPPGVDRGRRPPVEDRYR